MNCSLCLSCLLQLLFVLKYCQMTFFMHRNINVQVCLINMLYLINMVEAVSTKLITFTIKVAFELLFSFHCEIIVVLQ